MVDKLFARLTEFQILGNSLWRWFAVIIAAYIFHVVLRSMAKRFASKAPPEPNSLIEIFRSVAGQTKERLLLIVAVWFSTTMVMNVDPRYLSILQSAAAFALFLQFGLWTEEALTEFVKLRARSEQHSHSALRTAFGIIHVGIRIVVWSIVLLLILDNFGINVTALVAGLGVGGIAIALAVQSTLGDLLCSLSIVLDRPFEVGDFIITGDITGTVEKIGIKSTRIRALTGEQLVASNSDLIASRIRNFKRMQERRILFQVGVIYQTPPEKVRAIPGHIKEIIQAQEKARFDRSHFKAFGASSLDFETVYYVLEPDYNLFMDVQQAINIAVFEKFAEEGIEFAYPTQTLFIETPQPEEPENNEAQESAA